MNIIKIEKKIKWSKYYELPKDNDLWEEISAQKFLSEEFIEEFKDRVDWCLISSRQVLSEKFILKFKDYVWWNRIIENQNLSYNFIKKYKKYFILKITKTNCLPLIAFNSKISSSVKKHVLKNL